MNKFSPAARHRGFTLIEVLSVVAIIAILAAIAVGAYGLYMDRARSVEIIAKYDAIRTHSSLAARANTAPVADCAALAQTLDRANLPDRHATLSYAFEATNAGWRPVLNVCALAAQHGKEGVDTARQVYEVLSKNGVAEKNPVLSDSVVSFALRLSQEDRALCQVHRSQAAASCATGGGTVTQPILTPPVAVVTPPVVTPPVVTPPVVTPPGLAQAASSPAVVQPINVTSPGQTASQVAGLSSPQGPASVPSPGTTGNPRPPGQGTTTPGPQRPPPAQAGSGPLDVHALAAGLMGHNELGFLNRRDQEVVTATVAMMAMDPSYAQVVKAAIGRTPSRQPVNVPTSPQNRYSINFSGEMHRALEVLYPEAARRACLANMPAGTNCG